MINIGSYGINVNTQEGQLLLIEIAKLIAEKNGDAISLYIQNLGIRDQKALIEIAKIAALQKYNIFSAGLKTNSFNIQNYGFDPKTEEGQKALIEIAKLIAERNGDAISLCIQNFDIHDQKALIEIAKVAVLQKCTHIILKKNPFDDIQNYGIDPKTEEGQKALIEIAEYIAQNHGRKISENIQKSGIRDQKALIEIAKLAVQNDPWETSRRIQNFGIRDQKALLEIAALIASLKINPMRIPTSLIPNYVIDPNTEEGQKASIEMAKMFANKPFSEIALSIDKFHIANQKELIEIAKLAVQNNPMETSRCIQNFGIRDQKVLMEIAGLVRIDAGTIISRNNVEMLNYVIEPKTEEGQKALIDIAKIVAKQNGAQISQDIQKYEILDQKALIEIATIAAHTNSGGTSQYIQNYGIDAHTEEGQKALIKIARIAAKQNGRRTSQYIKNYGINAKSEEGQKALIEIAMIAAQQDGGGLSEHIQNYGIDAKTEEGQKALIDIATIVAKQNGAQISQDIQKYEILDQKALIKIAKLAAQQDGRGTSEYIQNYGIQNKSALIEIAMIAAQQDGRGISELIQNYSIDAKTIEGQKVLIEIAMLAAQQNGEGISENIQNYGIQNETALIEIAKIAHLNTCLSLKYLEKFALDPEIAKEIILLAFSSTVEESISSILYTSTHGYISPLLKQITAAVPQFQKLLLRQEIQITPEEVLKEFEAFDHTHPSLKPFLIHAKEACKELDEREKNGKINTQTRLWLQKKLVLFAGLTFLRASLLEDHGEKADHVQLLLQRIIDVQDPSLRQQLVFWILENPSLASLYKETITVPEYADLPIFLLFILSNGTAIKEELSNYIKILNKRLKGGIPPLKDANFQKSIIKGMLALCGDQVLEHQTKFDQIKCLLLHQDATKDHLKKGFQAMKSLIEMKEQKRIQSWKPMIEGIIQNPFDYLDHQYREVFNTLIPLPDELCNADKITEFLESLRDPSLIVRYAANIKKLPEAQVLLPLMGKAIAEQMTTKRSSRYENHLDINPHLNQVFRQPGLKEKWMQGIKVDLTELLATSSSTSSPAQAPNFKKLIQSSFDNQHAKSADYPELMAYLESKMGLETKTREEKGSLPSVNWPKEDVQKMIHFQQALVELCETNSAESIKKALACFPDKTHPGYTLQFHEDLKAWEKNLKEFKTKSGPAKESLIAIEGDDFYDFMACGTEVSGSCQSVDGDPSYNKCLLAYVIDGKNRMVAIKNEQGVIKARAILRLLIDQTTQEPVLFMEEIYPDIMKTELKEGLIAIAKRKAKNLNLPLLSQYEVEGKQRYPHYIESLGSPAPFEYVDALNGISQEGKFTIKEAFFLLFVNKKPLTFLQS